MADVSRPREWGLMDDLSSFKRSLEICNSMANAYAMNMFYQQLAIILFSDEGFYQTHGQGD